MRRRSCAAWVDVEGTDGPVEVVLPVRLEGLRRAFDKTGLKSRQTGVDRSVRYGRPLNIDYARSASEILRQVMAGIGRPTVSILRSPEVRSVRRTCPGRSFRVWS